MAQVDKVQHYNNQVFNPSELQPNWFFFSPKRNQARGPPVPFSLHPSHGTVEQNARQEVSQVQYLNLTLLIFEALSGLHINMIKSIIYPVNEVQNLEMLADILCCEIGSFPTTYLGLPLGAKHKSTEIWNGVVEKFEKNLATWQMQYLSTGGRLTLINSVLDSIPTYLMSLFSFPSKVQKKLDRIRRNFLWEGNSESHKFHLVKWRRVTLPKTLGAWASKTLPHTTNAYS
nr:uncharacterized protein LOC104114666 [Nicotiana tomentosiformis]